MGTIFYVAAAIFELDPKNDFSPKYKNKYIGAAWPMAAGSSIKNVLRDC